MKPVLYFLQLSIIPILLRADDVHERSVSQSQITVVKEAKSHSAPVPSFVENDISRTDDNAVSDTKGSFFNVSLPQVAKQDLKAAATGFGIGGGGLGGGYGGVGGSGFGGGLNQGGGFGGGYGGQEGFGGGKTVSEGNKYGADFGGLNKHVKIADNKYGNGHQAVKGVNSNLGFKADHGFAKDDANVVNKAHKKGSFGNAATALKTKNAAFKNDGSNKYATKYAKGNRFGVKGAHKKGHATKGFHNTVHKDEYVKNHAFHDDNNAVDFVDKFGDEGAFKTDVGGLDYNTSNGTKFFNRNNLANEGNFLSANNNLANKGHSTAFGNKGNLGHNAVYGQDGGNNFISGFGKGLHANNQYGGNFGGGFGGKQGGFGGTGGGYGKNFGGGYGSGFGGGGGYGQGGGGGFGFGRR